MNTHFEGIILPADCSLNSKQQTSEVCNQMMIEQLQPNSLNPSFLLEQKSSVKKSKKAWKRAKQRKERILKRLANRDATMILATQVQDTNKTPNPTTRTRAIDEDAIRIAIIHENYPKEMIDLTQIDLLKAALIDEINGLCPTENSICPRFHGSLVSTGALVLTCKDQVTLSWLKGVVPKLKPWDNAILKLVPDTELIQLIRIGLRIMGRQDKPEDTIRRIGLQNRELNVTDWIMKSTKNIRNGQLIILHIPPSSWDELKKVDFRPYVNFSRASLKRIGKHSTYDTGEEKDGLDMEGVEDEGTLVEVCEDQSLL